MTELNLAMGEMPLCFSPPPSEERLLHIIFREFFENMSRSQNIIVLVGGGHSAGKRASVHSIQGEILAACEDGSVNVGCLDLGDYECKSVVESLRATSVSTSAISVAPKPPAVHLKPSRFDFSKLRSEIVHMIDTHHNVILVHGIYALYDPYIRSMAQLKVFIDCDPDTRLIRMIRRDVIDHSQPLQNVLHTYLQSYRDEMRNFILPTKEFADVIIPHGAEPQSIRLILDSILPTIYSSGVSPTAKGRLPQNILRPRIQGLPPGFDSQTSKYYALN